MENETLYSFISKLQGQKEFTFENEPNITLDAINGKPADLNQALLYLMNWQADLPDIETIDNSWPLEFKTFSIDYQVAPFNPHPMQPKLTFHKEHNIDYYVSPRKFIRYTPIAGYDFMMADNFQTQYIVTITQIDFPGTKFGFATEVKFEYRIEILKQPNFIMKKILISETEK